MPILIPPLFTYYRIIILMTAEQWSIYPIYGIILGQEVRMKGRCTYRRG